MPNGRHDHHRSSGRSRDRPRSDEWDRHYGHRSSDRTRSLDRRRKDMHRPGHALRDEYTPSLRSSSLGRDSKRHRDERARKDLDREFRDRTRELEERERELREREKQFRRDRDRDYRPSRTHSDDELDRNSRSDRYRDSMRSRGGRDRYDDYDDRYDDKRRKDYGDKRDPYNRDYSKSSDSLEKVDPIKNEKANTVSRSKRDASDGGTNKRRSKRFIEDENEAYEREMSEKEKYRLQEERENRKREEERRLKLENEKREKEEKERELREKAERELAEQERRDLAARKKREREEQENRRREEREKREKEEQNRREKEQNEKREREERERREREERERRDKEERDRRDKEERNRRDKEERDRRDKEERDRPDREERDRRGYDDYDRRQRDDRGRVYPHDNEPMDYEERIRRDKEQYERDRRRAIEYENEMMKEQSFHQHQYNKEREVFEQERYPDNYETPAYGQDYSWGQNSHKPIVVTQTSQGGGRIKGATKNVVKCCSVLQIIFCFCLAALTVVAWIFYNGYLAIGPFAALIACLLLAVFGFLSVAKHNTKFMIVVKFIYIVCMLALLTVLIVYCYLAGSYVGDPRFRYQYHRDHVAYISVACLFVLIPAWISACIFVYIASRVTCCLPTEDDHRRQNNAVAYYP